MEVLSSDNNFDRYSVFNVLQASFFMTYVLTSGWASLSCEILQPLPLLSNFLYRYVLRNKDECTYGTWTFPYHTEVPRILLFGVMGFTCSIMAPLILPFLLVYFFLAYLVYRNQVCFPSNLLQLEFCYFWDIKACLLLFISSSDEVKSFTYFLLLLFFKSDFQQLLLCLCSLS